jgi:O-antigen/teichoic acid export membrane protein
MPFAIVKKLIVRGYKYWLGLILMIGFLKFDKIYLSHKVSTIEFANYTAASNLNDQLIIFLTIIIGSIAPIVIFNQAKKNVHTTIKKIMLYIIPVSIVVGIIISIASPFIIRMIFSDQYLDAVNIFEYYLIIFPLVSIDTLLSLFIYKMHFDNVFLLKWLCAAMLNILVIIIFFPALGYYSALLGNVTGYLINIMIGYYYFRKSEAL